MMEAAALSEQEIYKQCRYESCQCDGTVGLSLRHANVAFGFRSECEIMGVDKGQPGPFSL